MNQRLDQAKRFLFGRAKSAALRLVPLALLAAMSLPAASLNLSWTDPSFTAGFGSLTPLPVSGLYGLGVKFTGSASSLCVPGCELAFALNVTNQIGSTVFVAYEFEIDPSEGAVEWSITNGDQSTVFASGITVDDFAPETFTGNFEMPEGAIRFSFVSTASFDVNVPLNSIDFTPGAPVSVPEPGSMALLVTSGGVLALVRRRVRRQ